MKLSIIIPNYNGLRFLPACLASIQRQTYQNYEVLLADNGSTDGSADYVRQAYPAVRILALPRNMGFGAAVNQGIRSSKSPYIMLLNNDTTLEAGCLSHLMAVMKADPRLFSAGARILRLRAPHLTDSAGDYYSLMGYSFCRGQGLPPGKGRAPYPVFSNCACACVYRRRLLEKTGLFDERFFAYQEDVDLGFRARRLGLASVHCPSAVVYHVGSGTTSAKYTPFKVYHSARNNILLRHKNLTLLQRALHFPFRLSGILLKYLYFRRIQLGEAYRKGCLDGLRVCRRTAVPHRSLWDSLTAYLRTEPWILLGTVFYTSLFLRRHLLPEDHTINAGKNHGGPA